MKYYSFQLIPIYRFVYPRRQQIRKINQTFRQAELPAGATGIEEIACNGCSSHKQCTYRLVECTKEHGVDKCNRCAEFPCDKINDMLERSAEHKRKCKEVCSEQEYCILEKAFFNKENNLKK